MALFKIEKGLAENLSTKRPNTVEGYCYFTTNDGKFYIDTATANGTSNRVCLNAAKADKLRTARTITVNGDAEGSVSFDGSQNVTLTLDVPDLDELSTACSDLNKNKAPNNHASTETTYGKGDANNYGHVKLTDTISTSSTTGGTAATPNAVRTAYNLADTANTTANTNKTNIETINSTLETIQDDIEALENADKGKAPTNHASTATTYGGGTGSNYGHVKLSDATNSTSAASASIAATPKAVKAAYDLANTANTTANTNKTNIGTINSTISTIQDDIDALEEADKGKAPTSHASTATTYGKGDANNYGHLKLSDATNSTSSTTGGIAATPNAVKTAYDLANTANTTANTNVNSIKTINSTLETIQDDIDALENADKGKAPTSHASTATTYGKGDASNYGHVKLTDTISTSSTSSGIAATPNAVKTAYDLADTANTTANTNTSSINTINSTISTMQDDIDALEEADKGKAPTNHASSAVTYGKGDASNYGHLKLSNATNSTSSTSEGVAATPSAVKAAYDLANTANTTANTNKTNINTINSTLETIQDDIDALEEADKGKAPNNHASSATTYGTGDANKYGHVKLTDTISTSSSSEGVAATPNAVKIAYELADTANTTANTNAGSINTINSTLDTIQDDIDALEEADKGKAPNNHASTATTYGTGTDSKYGHLKLSAATNSTSGVSGGIAATPSAVKAAYDLASSKVDSLSDLGITATAATLNSVATDTDQLHKVWKTSSTGAPGWRTDAARYLQTFQQSSAPNDNGTTYGDNWKFYAQWITNDRLAFKVENNGANQASYPVEVNHAYKLVTPSTDSNSANAPLSVGSATKPVYFSEGVPVEANEFANKSEGAFFIEGSGTTDETAKTSTWTGESTRITEYYDGLTIRYKIGVKGQSTVTLNINGLGEKIVYRIGTTKLTTQFTVGSIINLTYHADLNEGCWMCNDYDANTQSNTNSTDTSSKIFLVGATSQGSNKTTYSHGEVYVGTDHHVYSNNKQVVNLSDTQALTNKTYNGYTLGAACAKGVDTSVTDGSSNLVTGDAVHTAITNVKNDLLNGAGAAYDTLKELGDLIDDNTDAIEALETVAANKAANTITITGTNGLTGGGNLTANRTISADLLSTTKLTNAAAAATETANRVYPVAMDKNGKLAVNIPWTNTTYNAATTSAAGLMSASDKAKLDGIATQANKYSLPTASSSTLGGVKIGSNINISSGVISVPAATKNTAGVTIVYPASSCTEFSTDSGTVTPAAVQKAAKQFAIPRPNYNPSTFKGSATDKAITRYSGTEGEVQDSKILIEDVTNTRDTTKKAQVISIPAEGGKKMVYGYCTDQIDGTSFIGGVFNADATEYPHAQGLAIGGTSGNLLWKGKVVATTDQIPTIPTSLKNPNSLTIQGNGTTLTNGVYDGSAAKTVNITPSAIGAAPSSHTHDDRYYTESETNTKLNAKLDKLTYEWNKEYSAGGTAGYLLIGSFPMYDTNVTIDIDATTKTTYHGTVVIATQNVSTTSMGSDHVITVYGDPTGTISDAIRVTWASGSRNYNVYFVPSTWSKNLIHIRAIGQHMDTIDTTKICTQFTAGTAPATTSGLTVVNALRSNFNNFTYTHPTTSGNKHIPSGGSSGQFLKWSADGTATWSADNNTTYSFATGDNNGQIKVTPSGGTAQNISVKGLGSAAYTDSSNYVTVTDSANYVTLTDNQTISGTKTMTKSLKVSGRYTGANDDEGIIVGYADNGYAGLILGEPNNKRSIFYFKNDGSKPWWRYNNGTASFDISHPEKSGIIALTSDITPDTKNTAGSIDTDNKIFLVGATSQTTSAQTYSHDQVFIDSSHNINATGVKIANAVTLSYNSADKSLDFIFA